MKKILKNNWWLLCFISLSCAVSKNSNKELANTKWSYDFGHDGVISYFKFEDKKNYIFFEAETGVSTFGTYIFNKDTIYIDQKYGDCDHEFPENPQHIAGEKKYQMLIRNKNQLGFMELWDNDTQKWKEDYFFTKE
ncbi:hypothetical protein [Flavobacterium sp. WV_118_3]|uniref:hypothetical protein n=1 Tax=Flavobacterium sp. WV_118_3 TaxID=3151764 RepID=UPI003219A01B